MAYKKIISCFMILLAGTNYGLTQAKHKPLSIADIQKLQAAQLTTEPYKPVTKWCLYRHGFYHGLSFDLWHSTFRTKLTPACRPIAHAARMAGKMTTLAIITAPVTLTVASFFSK